MSEKEFRSSMGKIRSQLQGKLSNVKKQFDYQEPQEGSQSTSPASKAGIHHCGVING
ncbi:Uncharacterised protein [Yokenella regensburgei]|nr:Uncharacterised protein [Yokenella regensburgei]